MPSSSVGPLVAATGDLAPEQRALFETVRAKIRPMLEEASPAIDRSGVIPDHLLKGLSADGLSTIAVPREYGGIASSDLLASDMPIMCEMVTELAAGDSSVGQVWLNHLLSTLHIFDPRLSEIPDGVRRRLAREIVEDGARIGVSAAEQGKTRASFSVSPKRVEGGVVLTGTKAFNTGHQSADYTWVWAVEEGAGSLLDGVVNMLVPMSSPGITDPDDWDNMGQRATASGSLIFDNVFVPDELVFPPKGGARAFFQTVLGPSLQIMISACILGMGYGALKATIEYLQEHARPWPTLSSATEDPYHQHHLGRLSANLEGARALQAHAAGVLRLADRGEASRAEASVAVAQSKIVTTAAALTASTDLFQLCGARATSNKYRLDRFLRSARTLTVHDPVDRKMELVGRYLLCGTEPPATNLS